MAGSPDDLYITGTTAPGPPPTEVDPGATVQASMTVENQGYKPMSNALGPDDHCIGPNVTDGVAVTYKVMVDGQIIGDDYRCLTYGALNLDGRDGNEKTRTYQFTAPTSPGWHTIRYVMEGKNTGSFFGSTEQTFKVAEESSGTVPDDGTGGDGGSDGSGDTGGDGSDGSDSDGSSGDGFLGGFLGGGSGGDPLAEAGNMVKLLVLLAFLYVFSQIVGGAGDIADATQ